MNYIVDMCSWTKFEDRSQLLHEAEQNAVRWLVSVVTSAFAK